jgi:hypothetical protein
MGTETSRMDAPRLKDTELIECMLRPKIVGEALDNDVAKLFQYVDLYFATPDEMVAGHLPGPSNNWYFLSHLQGGRLCRRHRHGGWWRPCTRMKVMGNNRLVGYRRFYSYMVKKVKTD